MTADCWLSASLPALPAVLASDGHTVWAALADGAVLSSGDTGRTWQHATPDALPAEPLALLATPEGLLATTERGLYRRHRSAWVHASAGLPADDLVTMLVAAESGVVAGTFASGLYHARPPARRWARAALPTLPSNLMVYALASGHQGLYAAHPLGISRSRDGGESWEGASFGLPSSVLINALCVGQAVWASGGGAIFRSDDGLTWQSVYARGNTIPLVLVACKGGILVARQADGTRLYRSHDGGFTWHAFSPGLPDGYFATQGVCVGDTLFISTLPAGVWYHDLSGLQPVQALIELLPQPPGTEGNVAFVLRAPAHVVLSVRDVTGSEVERLADGATPQGEHRYALGGTLPPGFYEWHLTSGGTSQARSFIYLP